MKNFTRDLGFVPTKVKKTDPQIYNRPGSPTWYLPDNLQAVFGEAAAEQLTLPMGTLGDFVAGCSHHYQNYIGITEAYKFCIYCDKKEPLDDDIK